MHWYIVPDFLVSPASRFILNLILWFVVIAGALNLIWGTLGIIAWILRRQHGRRSN
jgi:hypothetical protein